MLGELINYINALEKSGATAGRVAETRSGLDATRRISDEIYGGRQAKSLHEKKSDISIPVISLFSGCGGMDLGFVGGFNFLGTHYSTTGFKIIWANEINQAACRTYRKNLGDIVEGDISEKIDNMPDHADVVIGGFPCQDISINGKMLGLNGKRSSLYRYIVESIQKVKETLI